MSHQSINFSERLIRIEEFQSKLKKSENTNEYFIKLIQEQHLTVKNPKELHDVFAWLIQDSER